MKKLIYALLVMLPLATQAAVEESQYTKTQTDNSVIFDKKDGSGYAQLELLAPVSMVNTTKDYAQMLMDNYSGFDLQAVVQLRGYSFNFVDNAPCAGLLSYFDGSNYLFFKSCGKHQKSDLKKLYLEGSKDLKLEERLKRSSRASFY